MRTRTFLAPACALALAVIAPGASSGTSRKEEPVQRTLRFAGPGPHTLEVRVIFGNITVEAWDGNDVQLSATRTLEADTPEQMQAAEREVLLDVVDGASTVKAVVRYPNGEACGEYRNRKSHDWPDYEVRYDFTIRVPRDTRLVLCTINNGRLSVKGTRADFELRSVNGPITLLDMGGSGEATTVNGAVKGSFVTAPLTNSTFRTVNGDIELEMPASFAADLRMKTFNGGLYTNFDSQSLPTNRPIVAERDGDRTIYQSNSFATVRIGRGGPQLTMDTLNGDVRVLRSAP